MRSKNYTELQKREAIAFFVTLGSMKGAAEASGIPRTTLIGWRKNNSGWWERVASEVRAQEEDKYRARYSQIVDEATSAILDRIRHGDTRANSKGELYRIPVSARDLIIVGGTAQDKLRVSLGLPTIISAKAEQNSTKNKLEDLKKAVSGNSADVVVGIEGNSEEE